MFAPVVRVMLSWARIFPEKSVPVPRVAELPTRHSTPQELALLPLTKATDEPLAVVRVLPIRKTQTAFGLPWALRTRVPVS
jgi:hypothetical protein